MTRFELVIEACGEVVDGRAEVIRGRVERLNAAVARVAEVAGDFCVREADYVAGRVALLVWVESGPGGVAAAAGGRGVRAVVWELEVAA